MTFYRIDTLAKYDLPAKLELVANVTGQGGKIIYLGHSMGTTVGFMYASESNKNLVEKFIMMAPVAYMHGLMLIEMLIPIARSTFVSHGGEKFKNVHSHLTSHAGNICSLTVKT